MLFSRHSYDSLCQCNSAVQSHNSRRDKCEPVEGSDAQTSASTGFHRPLKWSRHPCLSTNTRIQASQSRHFPSVSSHSPSPSPHHPHSLTLSVTCKFQETDVPQSLSDVPQSRERVEIGKGNAVVQLFLRPVL